MKNNKRRQRVENDRAYVMSLVLHGDFWEVSMRIVRKLLGAQQVMLMTVDEFRPIEARHEPYYQRSVGSFNQNPGEWTRAQRDVMRSLNGIPGVIPKERPPTIRKKNKITNKIKKAQSRSFKLVMERILNAVNSLDLDEFADGRGEIPSKIMARIPEHIAS